MGVGCVSPRSCEPAASPALQEGRREQGEVKSLTLCHCKELKSCIPLPYLHPPSPAASESSSVSPEPAKAESSLPRAGLGEQLILLGVTACSGCASKSRSVAAVISGPELH